MPQSTWDLGSLPRGRTLTPRHWKYRVLTIGQQILLLWKVAQWVSNEKEIQGLQWSPELPTCEWLNDFLRDWAGLGGDWTLGTAWKNLSPAGAPSKRRVGGAYPGESTAQRSEQQWCQRPDARPITHCCGTSNMSPTPSEPPSSLVKWSEVTQSCLTVILWAAARQAPLLMGFPRQEYLEWVAISSPGDLPDSSLLQSRQILYHQVTREAKVNQ